MIISLKADETRYIKEHNKTATDSHIFNIKIFSEILGRCWRENF